MKTKTIPFDLDTAKKIQTGEIEGKIKQQHGEEVEILCWDLNEPNRLAVKHRFYDEDCEDCGIHVDEYNINGEFYDRSDNMAHNDLIIEVPNNEMQFEPFDKVLVRNGEGFWKCALFSHMSGRRDFPYYAYNSVWEQCIQYEGNEHLVGTTDKPKEE